MTVLRNSRVSRISLGPLALREIDDGEQGRIALLVGKALEIDSDIHHAAIGPKVAPLYPVGAGCFGKLPGSDAAARIAVNIESRKSTWSGTCRFHSRNALPLPD